MIAGPSNAGSTDYAIKYNTWELIAIPNPTRFDQNTPAKLFFMRILPVAEGLKLRQGARALRHGVLLVETFPKQMASLLVLAS